MLRVVLGNMLVKQPFFSTNSLGEARTETLA